MIAPHTLELTMEADKATFHRLHESVKNRKAYNRETRKDYTLVKDGITVWYHKSEFKKKIKLIINPSKVLGFDDLTKLWNPKRKNIAKFLTKLNSRIDSYFDAEYTIEDFTLTRIDFTKNIKLDDPNTVVAYIKALKNIRKVKGFSPKDCTDIENYDKDASFDLDGNSNGVEFTAYDKAAAIRNNIENKMQSSEYRLREIKERLAKAEGLLRLETKLTTQKAIRCYTNKNGTVKRIIDLCSKSEVIFLDTFIRVVPFGDMYKKEDTEKIVKDSVSNKNMRQKMLRLIGLIPQKKSLLLAQKAMADRNIESIMKMFAKLNVSPVTLSKRHKVKHLKNLYAFMGCEFTI